MSVSNFSQIQNQTLNQTPAPSSPPLEKDAAWLAGFEEFWTNYPRKDARRKAEQAWRNVKGKERPRLVELMQALGRNPAARRGVSRMAASSRCLRLGSTADVGKTAAPLPQHRSSRPRRCCRPCPYRCLCPCPRPSA
ncbi:hypothetical protein [Verrucomicrobium spinosum]|uniref:hypothetical protein n=1 Tax=Verrucomicrobium spinosum TaxID=2736 RepID=UPI0012E1A58D|nr:hypothetical protein [Verrucomicrobium spinosum]